MAGHNYWSFRTAETGSTSILFGVMALVLFAFIGGALDYARLLHARDRTSQALDSAVLAAGRTLQTETDAEAKALTVARVYFEEQIKQRFEVLTPVVEFTIGDNGLSIHGRATGKVNTPFMGVVGMRELPLAVDSSARLAVGGNGNSGLEISLMLDVTGSMCDGNSDPCQHGSKIDGLKTSANDLIDIVMRDHNEGNTRIALVPFSTRVRVASRDSGNIAQRMKNLTNLDDRWSGWIERCKHYTVVQTGSSEQATIGSCDELESVYVDDLKVFPCVSDRSGPQEFTDAAPGPNTWLNTHDGGRNPLSHDSSDTPIADGDHLGQRETDPANFTFGDPQEGVCGDVPPENVVIPLSNDKQMLKDHVEGLTANGSTSGALGTAWAWYMLSPNFGYVWPSASRPAPYSTLTETDANGNPKLRKIAVLMTDGLYNTYRSWKDFDASLVSNNAKRICANMKASGVEIFTVGFDLDSLPAGDRARAEDVLKTCGTDISHFYEAIDPERLRQSFRDIALKLSQLYIER